MAGTIEWPRARGAFHGGLRRRAVLAAAVGLLVLFGGCVQPEPRSVEPSTSASTSVSAAEAPFATVEPTAAEVTITAGDLSMSYNIDVCPVTAWLDPDIGDGVSFGIYPEDVTASDGARWSTHMVVLDMVNGAPTDWSFTLTTPLGGIPGGTERSLISRPDNAASELSAAFSDGEATFTAAVFWDSEVSYPAPTLPGTVTVTCR